MSVLWKFRTTSPLFLASLIRPSRFSSPLARTKITGGMVKEARLSRILIYPIKGLDPQEVSSASFTRKGSLKHDREFALIDEEGNVVSGKREKKIHRIRSHVDFDTEVIKLSCNGRSYSFSFF